MDDFQPQELLHEAPHLQIHRGRLANRPAILKQLDTAAPRHAQARFRHEQATLKRLARRRCTNIARPIRFEEDAGKLSLLLEDCGGRALSESMGTPRDLLEVLQIAASVAFALSELHQAGCVHKHLCPSHVVYNTTTRHIELIGLASSSTLSREHAQGDEVPITAYMAPEQTGHVARSVDCRADFYALGVLLYELLVDELPFVQDSPSALAFAIVTQAPTPLGEQRPDLPPIVLEIVAKLLAKDPEDRYSSAHGLMQDLAHCATLLEDQGSIVPFPLGQHDLPEIFHLPERLYGRQHELEILQAAYRQAVNKQRAVVTVQGPSGMGKTSLVNELRATLLRHDSIFAAGKYDPLHRDIPFGAFAQAMEAVVQHITRLDAAAQQLWCKRLVAALGNVGQAVLDIAPALQTLVGPQKALPALAPRETENRLLTVLQRLMACLCENQPLVLFLDDLQWADGGTLELVRALAGEEFRNTALLVVVAYRQDSFEETPLQRLLDAWERDAVRVQNLQLQPLNVETVGLLVRDATQAPGLDVSALAQAVHAKSDGNPFFVHSTLQMFHDTKLLQFDARNGYWVWRAAPGVSAADGAPEAIFEHLAPLKAREQAVLGAAACVGFQFNLADLIVAAAQLGKLATERLLEAALRRNLVHPVGDTYRLRDCTALHMQIQYRFAHDRIQQAAYTLLDQEARARVHHALGEHLLTRPDHPLLAGRIFAVAEQFNKAAELRGEVADAGRLAGLNLGAGVESMRASAVPTAETYLRRALSLLPEDAWTSQYQLCRAVHSELADVEFFAGNVEAGRSRLAMVLERATTLHDRAETLRRAIVAHTSGGRALEAIEALLQAMTLLEVTIPAKPSKLHLLRAFLQLQLALRGGAVEQVGNAPFTEDQRVIDVLRLAESINGAAMEVRPDLIPLLSLQSARLVLQHGLSRRTPGSLSAMLVLACSTNNYEAVRTWAQVVRRCLERVPEAPTYAMTPFMLTCYHDHLELQPPQLAEQCTAIHHLFREEGSPQGATWPLSALRTVQSSYSLQAWERGLEDFDTFVFQHEAEPQRFAVALQRQVCAYLLGKQSSLTYLENAPQLAALPFPTRVNCLEWGIIVYWLQGDYNRAASFVERAFAGPTLEGIDINLVRLSLFAAITLTQQALQGTRKIQQRNVYQRVVAKLRALGQSSPSVFAGLASLLDAEEASVDGRPDKALVNYDLACRTLSTTGYVSFAAAAAECAARYARAQGQQLTASFYWQRGIQLYGDWGAVNKKAALEKELAG